MQATVSALSNNLNAGVRVKCLPDAQVEVELKPCLAVVKHVEDGHLDEVALHQLRLRVALAKEEEQVVHERNGGEEDNDADD